MNRNQTQSGFTLIELLVLVAILGLLFGIGFPAMQSTRLSAAFSSAEQEVAGALRRARWSAITSGRPTTTVELTSPTVITIRDGATVLSTVNVAGYGVQLSASATTFGFDGRGLVSGALPSFTVTSPRLSASRTLTVNSLGKIQTS